ncbi:hypothetical protein RISK_005484 [Rhodopirellula islandica]|uniref:Uncharacterized protein n=1 Tax=Rhodopirellula islandica TaxID=595434 RepID=A0A0J1B775_RHOIS|nr:hypothetical protein RISK_005484 [Rhodopirellula islandica]
MRGLIVTQRVMNHGSPPFQRRMRFSHRFECEAVGSESLVLVFASLSNLSRNEVWGERRRSGVREGEGRAREAARVALPRKSR